MHNACICIYMYDEIETWSVFVSFGGLICVSECLQWSPSMESS